MTAIIKSVIFPEPRTLPAPRKTKKTIKRERHIERRGDDPEGNVLPMLLQGHAKGAYRKKLMERDGHCIYCRKPITPDDASLEHAIPFCDGGPDAPWNLWLCCKRCNTFKSNLHPLKWLEQIHRACIKMGLLSDDPEPIDWSGDCAASG